MFACASVPVCVYVPVWLHVFVCARACSRNVPMCCRSCYVLCCVVGSSLVNAYIAAAWRP